MTIKCLEEGQDCKGEVEYHSTDPGFRRAFPRCEAHWTKRVRLEQDLNRRYPVQQPSDFDPLYAGERWDEDY